MKHIISLVILASLLSFSAHGQKNNDVKDSTAHKTDTLPYMKYPTLPAVKIMLRDSVTIFNTYNTPEGKPTLILFFDPDCIHCKDEIRMLLANMDSLKDTRFYMITSVHNFGRIRKFYEEYNLADYKNIEVFGRDYEYFFITYYGVKFVPDLVLYDKHKNLVKLFEGHVTVDELYRLTH